MPAEFTTITSTAGVRSTHAATMSLTGQQPQRVQAVKPGEPRVGTCLAERGKYFLSDNCLILEVPDYSGPRLPVGGRLRLTTDNLDLVASNLNTTRAGIPAALKSYKSRDTLIGCLIRNGMGYQSERLNPGETSV